MISAPASRKAVRRAVNRTLYFQALATKNLYGHKPKFYLRPDFFQPIIQTAPPEAVLKFPAGGKSAEKKRRPLRSGRQGRRRGSNGAELAANRGNHPEAFPAKRGLFVLSMV